MPIITIFGATGKQGSAVLSAVLADGTFTPRAVSRNTDSESAKQLKSKGIEVVKGDLYDNESLKAAIGEARLYLAKDFHCRDDPLRRLLAAIVLQTREYVQTKFGSGIGTEGDPASRLSNRLLEFVPQISMSG